MKIFVSLASYRDSELPFTILSLVENADQPQNLHIGVVQQCQSRERISFPQNSHISEVWMPSKEARGAGYARSVAQSMYRGEDFFMQVDSHTRVDRGWDTKLKQMHGLAQQRAGTDKIILSQFPKAYIREAHKDVSVINKKYPAHPTKQELLWATRRVWSAARVEFEDQSYSVPEESHTVLAGFIFANGSIVNEVPYDPDISFFGEELCYAIRAWTRGYRIYSPNEMVISHFYTRPNHHKIWDAANNSDKKWGRLEKVSMDRQAAVYNGDILGQWGAPSLSLLNEYYEFIGIDVPGIYDNMLNERGIQSETYTEADINIFGFQEFKSIPCMDDEHLKCGVQNCECPCH